MSQTSDKQIAAIFADSISTLQKSNTGLAPPISLVADLMVVTLKFGNTLNAVSSAQNKQMSLIAVIGKDAGKPSAMIQSPDINICVPSNITARIQEVHGLVIHCFCEIIDQHFALT